MEPHEPGLRIVEVRPPSVRDETIQVARALFAVGMAAALVVAVQVGDGGRAPTAADDAKSYPFVRRFADLAPADQRIFNAIREGLGEAERRRVSKGAWPDVPELAADGIPPFAPDPIDRDAYAWSMRTAKGIVNYVGTPRAGSNRAAFVVIVAEPDGSAPATTVETPADEVHHRLAKDLLVHAGVFVGAGLAPPAEVAPNVSFDDGWQQVLAGPPSVLSR